MPNLLAAAGSFLERYRSNPSLIRENRGWSRSILLHSEDSGERVKVEIADGHPQTLYPAPEDAAADIVITAPADVLRDVLLLTRSPNEPYLFGELSVRGSQEDFVRIDYIAVMLCAA